MNYEEKYRKALSFLKDLKPLMSDYCIEKLEGFFPELRESDDERIRKELIQYLKDYPNLPNGHYCRDDFFSWLEKQGEQKPDFCHHEVDLSNCSEEYRKAYYDGWNNCNQQHAQLEAEQKSWSKEDESWFEEMELMCLSFSNDTDYRGKFFTWLKSLKEKVLPSPKQELSEDDSWMLNVCCNAIDSYKESVDKYLVKNWLKSLKPKNHWKPSEEQMEALLYALGRGGTYNHEALTKLYNDLKKL